ncbi:hypothetical protein F9K91_23835, partial [Brucella tritici]
NILLALSTTCPHPIPLFPYSPIPLFPYSPIPLLPYGPSLPVDTRHRSDYLMQIVCNCINTQGIDYGTPWSRPLRRW